MMSTNDDGFNPLDSLSAGYGGIDSPNLDSESLSAFESDDLKFDQVKPREINYPLMPSGLTSDVKRIQKRVVGQPPGRQTTNFKGVPFNEKARNVLDYLHAKQSTITSKRAYAPIYSYDASSKGNAFFKRYYAYGPETFAKLGFHPLVDNEANFNAHTSGMEDFKRQLTESFMPLATSGFTAGPKSLLKMFQGDFTSTDLKDAKVYEEASAIGLSSKKGPAAFFSNVFMNFGYTAGIISEIMAEEAVAGLLAPESLGLSSLVATKNAASSILKLAKNLKFSKGVENTASTLNSLSNASNANKFWKAVNSPVGMFVNPISNTMRAIKASKVDNLTNLATTFRTANGFYRDVRSLNASLSESRLEGGLVQNSVYDNKYNKFIVDNNRIPTDKEQEAMLLDSKKGGLETLMFNLPLIYFTNKLAFNNILNKGSLRNVFKSGLDDYMNVGSKNFGNIGKVVYDKASKKFLFEKNNILNLGKSWIKNPISKSVYSTVKYFKSNISEGLQENAQEIISRANEKFYSDSYNSPFVKSSFFTKARTFNTPFSVYKSELDKEFSAQGLETFGSGFFMGVLGGSMNKSFSFLSTTYNKIFDKEGYKKWKETKEETTNTLINNLNNLNIKDFLSNRYINAGAQNTLSIIKQDLNKKGAKDVEFEALIEQMSLIVDKGASDIFKEKLESLRSATDEELQEEIKFDDIKEASSYRNKIENTIAKVDSIKNAFEVARENFPNPITNFDLSDPKNPNFAKAVVLKNAWDLAVKNLVYVNESFKDVGSRSLEIKQLYLKNAGFGNITNSSITALFQPNEIVDNLGALNNDLSSLKKNIKTSSTKEKDRIKIKFLETQIKDLENYKVAYDKFNRFYNRTEYINEVKETLAQDIGEDVEIKPELIESRMSEIFGNEKDQNAEVEIIKELKDAHDKYIRNLSDSVDGTVFNNDLDDAFNKLLDFYKLKKESRLLAKNIDFFSDPTNFYEIVEKNSEWMNKMYRNRKKYFTNLVNEEINNIEDNALLNQLASEGIYMSVDDFIKWRNLRTKPTEFFNNITKEVYLKDSAQYNKIYDEYMTMANELKAISQFKKDVNLTGQYNIELAKLQDERDEKINKLEKFDTKVPQDNLSIKNKSISIKDLNELKNNTFIELSNSNGTFIIYKNNEGILKFDDDNGELVDLESKTRYNKEHSVYKIEQLPNPEELKKIEEDYKKEETSLLNNFSKDIKNSRIELEEPYTKNSDFNKMSLVLKKQLYDSFIDTIETSTVEDIINKPDNNSDEFKEWVNNNPAAELIINNFNNSLKALENYKFVYLDKTLNTKDLSNNDINNYINLFEKDLEKSKDDNEKAKIKLIIAKLEQVLTYNYSKNMPIKQKETLDLINKKIIIPNKENVEKDYVLLEDDEITGLKKGDKAYRINGNVHSRVTRVIQNFLKDYRYTNEKEVLSVFNSTLKNNITEEGIINFINELKEKKLEGFNNDLYKALKLKIEELINPNQNRINALKADLIQAKQSKNNAKIINIKKELAALKGASVDNLDLNVLYNDILNFISEETYADGRLAGNYIDLVKNFLQYGEKPPFDKKSITDDAYNSLFGDDGYITEIKRKLDKEGSIVIGNDLVVWDSDIIGEKEKKSRIAGEIDLLVIDKEGNISIIDIKTGKESKWTNFNTLSSADKELFPKRNEYTLQQAVYANLLERMLKIKVSNIGLLPVERISNPETNQIISAGKPQALTVLTRKLVYNGKINKFDEKIFDSTSTENEINDMFIPLYRDSVKNEMTKIFGLDTENIKREEDKINNENIIEKEKNIEDVISFFEAQQVITADWLAKKNEEFEKAKISVDVTQFNITDDFINKRLDENPKFKKYYEKHSYFENLMGDATNNQITAIKVLNNSKILTDLEIDNLENLNMSEASSLIHTAVIRIEYLLNSDVVDKNKEKFKTYTQSIFLHMSQLNTLNQLNEILEAFNKTNKLIKEKKHLDVLLQLNDYITTIEFNLSLRNISKLKEAQLINYKNNFEKYKEAYEFLYKNEINEANENQTFSEKYNINIDDRYFKKKENNEYEPYFVIKIDKNKVTLMKGEKGKTRKNALTVEIDIEKLNNNYMKPSDFDYINDNASQDKTYNPSDNENIIIKENNDNLDAFLNNNENDILSKLEKEEGIELTEVKTNLFELIKKCS